MHLALVFSFVFAVLNPCHYNPCKHGTCEYKINTDGTYDFKCTCAGGYSGTTCGV